jgi:hypothetical protein
MTKINPYKDLQELFNAAYLGMAKQNFQPAFGGGSCVYLTHDKQKRCAIGHTIPDSIIHRMPFTGAINSLRWTATVASGDNYPGKVDYMTGIYYAADSDKASAYNELKELFKNIPMHELSALQDCHDFTVIHHYDNDNDVIAEKIKKSFEAFAKQHNLVLPVPETAVSPDEVGI